MKYISKKSTVWKRLLVLLILGLIYYNGIGHENKSFQATNNYHMKPIVIKEPQRKAKLPQRKPKSVFEAPKIHIMPSYKYGNIISWSGSFGYYLAGISESISNDLYIETDYNFSKQSYSSDFFIDPKENYELTFHSIFFGVGYNFELLNSSYSYKFRNLIGSHNKRTVLFLTPQFKIGYEFTDGSEIMFDQNIDLMYAFAYRPGLRTGLRVNKISYVVGLDYTFWNSMTNVTQGKILVVDGDEKFLSWDEDLFRNRNGIQIYLGVLFSF